jgi:2-methylisocitrate lyase-like PEP mutase family enzyme
VTIIPTTQLGCWATATTRALTLVNQELLLKKEYISRFRAFDKAGAEVLFAPGLPDLAVFELVLVNAVHIKKRSGPQD